MIARDMSEVLAIENRSYESPWVEDDFIRFLRQKNCIGMVAKYDNRVVGFMIYEIHKQQLRILNFAVHPEVRRESIGCQMVEKLIGKLSRQRRNKILLEISEYNTPAQQFFSEMGFKATSVLKNYYDDCDEDAYVFRYELDDPDKEMLQPHNRITRHLKEN